MSKIPDVVLTSPRLVIPTKDNYGTGRFRHGEIIICKECAFVVQFISAKKLSMKLLDKRVADELLMKSRPMKSKEIIR